MLEGITGEIIMVGVAILAIFFLAKISLKILKTILIVGIVGSVIWYFFGDKLI